MSDIHALSGAYAVDALDETERADFEKHLADCDSCRAEVDGLRAAAATLAASVAVDPPAHLRDRVLGQIATMRPDPPRVVPLRRTSVRRWWPTMMVAAAAVVLLAAGTVLWQPWQQDEGAPVASPAERVMTADDVQRVRHATEDGTVLTVYRSPSLGQAVLTTDGLPPAPDGHVYELWLQDEQGAMEPAGLFDAYEKPVLVEGDAGDARGLGITVEPDGGSPVPTSTPLAVISLDAA